MKNSTTVAGWSFGHGASLQLRSGQVGIEEAVREHGFPQVEQLPSWRRS
ncbi:hypothetical protein [Nostoc sp. CHAB 5715]|nr:hypothetical protein [Nostoc sp. CHAB 5715]MCC5625383.1 hypothetical protein [Nostoc sp. CHAB 5715]